MELMQLVLSHCIESPGFDGIDPALQMVNVTIRRGMISKAGIGVLFGMPSPSDVGFYLHAMSYRRWQRTSRGRTIALKAREIERLLREPPASR